MNLLSILLSKLQIIAIISMTAILSSACVSTGDDAATTEEGEGEAPATAQRTDSIRAMEVNFLPVVRSMNCATCHNSNHFLKLNVSPAEIHNTLFARGLIDLTTPSASRFYQKINAGHNGSNSVQATALLGGIRAWGDALNSIPAPPPPPSTNTNTDTATDTDTDVAVDPAPPQAPAPPPPPQTTSALQMMQTYCMTCHTTGSFGATAWGNISTLQELEAFAYRPDDRIIPGDPDNSVLIRRTLHGPGDQSMPPGNPRHSQTEYRLLYDWIASLPVVAPTPQSTPAPTPPPTPRGDSIAIANHDKLRLGDRRLIKSIFDDIFGPSVDAVTRSLILSNVSKFGGACDELNSFTQGGVRCDEPSGAGISRAVAVDIVNIDAPAIPSTFVTREGYRLKACNEILYKDQAALEFVIRRMRGASAIAGLAGSPELTRTEVINTYQLFFPGRSPSSDITDRLLDVSARAQAAGLAPPQGQADNRFESWRYVLLTLCRSPTWQTE